MPPSGRCAVPTSPWTSLFWIFWLQALLLWIISWPLQAVFARTRPLTALDAVGVGLAVGGILIEAMADAQLSRFRALPGNRDRVLDTGLWAWSRHPNYFGDFLLWWGLFLIGMAADGPWWMVLSPVVMSALLIHYSGAGLMEDTIANRRPGYTDYVRRTSLFFPLPPVRRPVIAPAIEIRRAHRRLPWQARLACRPIRSGRRDIRLKEPAGTVSVWSDCIVAIARTRDREAFAKLFAHFAPRLKSFFLRFGAAPGTAEDLAQETMLAVWHKAGLFDPARAAASTWIFTIARNLRVDLYRRQRDPAALAEFFEQTGEPLASDTVLSAERDAQVRVALSTLSDDQLQVIRLSFFEDLAHGEIARRLDVPLGTVKSRIRLAMNRLRALIEDEK